MKSVWLSVLKESGTIWMVFRHLEILEFTLCKQYKFTDFNMNSVLQRVKNTGEIIKKVTLCHTAEFNIWTFAVM